jgi:hypothetical protein
MAEGKTASAARDLADQYKAMIAEIIKEKNRDA